MASTAPKLIVEPACCVCGKKDGLRLCSMCNAVHYCSKAHQKSDRLDHKGPCHLIKKFRGKIDFLWGEMEEPPLDEAEFILVQLKYLHDNIISELVKIPTSKAMRMAIDFAEGCPHYPISELGPLEGILDHLPFAHLRLGKDQYSLDLLGCLATLRWPTDDFDDHQDWQLDEKLPSECKDSSVFENPRTGFEDERDWNEYMRPLSYWTCVLLHKLKALLGPQGVQNVSILSSKLPLEITYQIQGEFATSAMTSYAEFASDIRRGRVVSPRVKTLQQHIEALVNAIHEEDDCFWAFFMNPQQRFTPGPGCRCSGLGEAHHTMNRCYNTFAETPGAVVISLRTWFSRIHSTAAARESPQKTQKHVH